MPPETLPWDRKFFFKERKRERSSEFVGSEPPRWRETPHRWGSAGFHNRNLEGHDKQGGWRKYSEESGHRFTPSGSNDESFRPSGSRVEGKWSRNSKENRGSFCRKDRKRHYWEVDSSPNGSSRPLSVSGQRSVDESHPHSEFLNNWDRLRFKEHRNKTSSVNGLDTGKRFERGNSLGSTDWKPLKWARSASLSSRVSGFGHPSSSKSMGVDSSKAKAELQLGNVFPLQAPSGDAVTSATSAAPSEDNSFKKKPRISWGDGLAKYEKKNVEGPDDSAAKHLLGVCVNTEPSHSQVSDLSDKSPRFAGFSDCNSPVSPSSVACSSSPGLEHKPSVKAENIDNGASKLNGSSSLSCQNHLEGTANLENSELTPIANFSSFLGELLQSDDHGSVDCSFERSTAMKKLLVWKRDILKAVEITESEIDLLEIELKSLTAESSNSWPCLAGSSSLLGECQAQPCGEVVVASSAILRPAPLQLVSSGDMIAEEAVGGLTEESGPVKGENINIPGAVASKFVEPLSTGKAAAPESVKHGESNGDLDASKSGNLEVNCSVYGSNEKSEGVTAAVNGGELIVSKSCSAAPFGAILHWHRDDILCDQILAANKDSANRTSEVFNKLLPSEQCGGIDMLRATCVLSWKVDPLIKKKFAMRKLFLRFKERVISFKFRILQHLWKEDMQLLSIWKYRAKSQKRLELSSRILHNGCQKRRSSSHSRFSSRAGSSSLVPTVEMINFSRKLLSDSQVKLYRNSLKMPALILDKKEKMSTRFISSNGLVEDPCAVEKERVMINCWTTEEVEIFMDKLATFGKEFRKIASFLDHKTTADCIEFYYKNHKSDCFVKIKRKPEFAEQGKLRSTNYLVMSGRRWEDREKNAASLDMLGLPIPANAGDGRENQQNCTTRFLKRATTVGRASQGSLDIFSNERETVAADVLAGICGSLSSGAKSSSITSSFGPEESYRDWKCPKVNSSMRRPLTPVVTQNIDDETYSDESCGEMNPADWTDDEKSIFIQAVSSYGKDFTMISRCVRTRSRDECKVFFSKARKCLGLDMIRPRSGSKEVLVSDNTNNGGGSDNEDASVLGTGSVICSEISGSKIDEELMLSGLNKNRCESDPAETMNVLTDFNRTEANNRAGSIGGKDPELPSGNIVMEDWRAEGEPESLFDGDSKMENGIYSMSVMVQAQENAVLPHDTKTGGDDAIGKCTSLGESLLAKESNHHSPSVSGAKGEIIALGPELEVQQLASDDNLNDKQEEDGDANKSGPSDSISDEDLHRSIDISNLAALSSAPVELGVDPKQEQKIALELNPTPDLNVTISLEQDVSLVDANSVTKAPPAGQYENNLNLETPSTLDLEKTSVKHCLKSANADDLKQHHSGRTPLEYATSCQILNGYPVQVTTKKELNGASLQSLSKVYSKFSSAFSQECSLRKCNGLRTHSSVAKLPFMSQEQKGDHSRPHSQNLSDTGKPSRNGDVKLFGQILTPLSPQQSQNTNLIRQNEDKGVQHSKLSSKNFNPKFSSIRTVDGNPAPAKLDRVSYLGLENVPMSYGFWDGKRVRTGFSALPDSAILLAKYPAAFGDYSTSSTNMDLQPLPSAVSGVPVFSERSLSGVPVFSNVEISRGNGVAGYQFSRNQEGARVQTFTADMKQRQDLLLSEMQRGNVFEAVSNIRHAKGMVGINFVERQGGSHLRR